MLPLHLDDVAVLGRCVVHTHFVEGESLVGPAAAQGVSVAVPVTQQHLVPDPGVKLFLLPRRLLEDDQVGEHHDGTGYPERHERGNYSVHVVGL